MTKLAGIPVVGTVPAGGYVVVTQPDAVEPAKSRFAKILPSVITSVTGTVSTGTTGQLAVYPANGTNVAGATMSGDATITTAGAITVTKTGGVAFGPVATASYSSNTPLMDGTGAPGTATQVARVDHVHPTDTTRAAVSALPGIATTSVVGLVKPDGTTITIDGTGKIVSVGGVSPSSTTPLMDGTAAIGSGTTYARNDHVHPTDTTRAPLVSPTFTGVPAAPTATAGTATTQLATTQFVASAVAGGGTFVDAPSNGINYGRRNAAWNPVAPLADPAFTGTVALSGSLMSVVDPTNAATTAQLRVTNTGGYGAGIQLAGDGATTPNKFLRAQGGQLHVINSAYSTIILTVNDTGGLTAASHITGADLIANGGLRTVAGKVWFEATQQRTLLWSGGALRYSTDGGTNTVFAIDDASSNVTVNGALVASGTIAISSNLGGGYTRIGSGTIGWNYGSGSAEIDFINEFTGSTDAFRWYQRRDASNLDQVMSLSHGGTLTLPTGRLMSRVAGSNGCVAVSDGSINAGMFLNGTGLGFGTTDANAVPTALWATLTSSGLAVNGNTVATVTQASANVGRNLIHNSLFNIAQRGAGPFTTSQFTLDRWSNVIAVAGTASIVQSSLSDADRTAIGDEAASRCLSNTFTGSASAGAYLSVGHSIEGVRRLAGKTVTVSFWANATAALKLGINMVQSFGSGGSPSASQWALPTGASVSIPGTAWARYSTTIALPSATGKTLGTSGDDFTQVSFWYSAASSVNALAGNIGVQSGLINIWGVQLEIGSTMTPLEKPDPQQDLAKCQRFYQSGQVIFTSYAGGSAVGVFHSIALPVTMRATPVMTVTPGAVTNLTGLAGGAYNGTNIYFSGTSSATGGTQWGGTYTASADL